MKECVLCKTRYQKGSGVTFHKGFSDGKKDFLIMDLKAELDTVLLRKLTAPYVYHVTCFECCKYYIAPETAACGHTLCHSCWKGRRTCPYCAAPLEKRRLKINSPLQTRTKDVQTLGEKFEKYIDIKFHESDLDVTVPEVDFLNDPTKNVKDWLASSQNHFSAALLNSEPITQETNNPVESLSTKIQIHTDSKKIKSPEKVFYVHQPQDDWDKIEEIHGEESTNKENIRAKNNQVMSLINVNEYTVGNPRRSSRNKDLDQGEPTSRGQDISLEKYSSKNSSGGTDQKSNKAKQNWINVKRMRKEFSKLNKKNKNKLNVSIEMCKKAQSTVTKSNMDIDQEKHAESESPQAEYVIEENTPVVVQEKPKDSEQNFQPEMVENNSAERTLQISDKTASKNANQSLFSHNLMNTDQDKNIPLTVSVAKSLLEDVKNKSNNLNNNSSKMAFIKRGALCPRQEESQNMQTINIDGNTTSNKTNTEDIKITIKVGNNLTNIVIKNKTNDVQLKVNTDREVQTSLETNTLVSKRSNTELETTDSHNLPINVRNDKEDGSNEPQSKNIKINKTNTLAPNLLQKSLSTKKNTASAETATAHFEITESVEKELSNIMECEEIVKNHQVCLQNKLTCPNNQSQSIMKNAAKSTTETNRKSILNESHITDDMDIFENASVCEQNLQMLKNSSNVPSEILPTAKSTKVANRPDKRSREDKDEMPVSKKFKSTIDKTTKPDGNKNTCSIFQESNRNTCSTFQKSSKNNVANNDSMNYDVVMDQVFASIDADMQKSPKENKGVANKLTTQSKHFHMNSGNKKSLETSLISTQIIPENEPVVMKPLNEKYSENVFSIVEKDTDSHDIITKEVKDNGSTQHHIDYILTPRMCQDLVSTEQNLVHDEDIGMKDMCTPYQDQDDSDKSVVEETPQKTVSFTKPKNINETEVKRADSEARKEIDDSPAKSIINVSDSMVDSHNNETIIINVRKTQALETPLTINKFVEQISHKSTPVARKSLNFGKENTEDDDDSEQTLCPSSVVAKTTQEKEIMTKAFEQTQKSLVKMSLATKNIKLDNLKYCIAGSCLSGAEVAKVKLLCRKHNWNYVDKYTKELTHLVVGVDEENKSQRSVKYMCALAASKWIVSYKWVEACLKTNIVMEEIPFEALDGTGEPGPRRSRMAKKKLFQGITFYCMPPFSVLDVNTLKDMLEVSGGRVVNDMNDVKATAEAPALLLAEPEHTQDKDRFMNLALKLHIVPVNYEWALNCLGSYALSSIYELLLSPSVFLPSVTSKWPAVLISRDSE